MLKGGVWARFQGMLVVSFIVVDAVVSDQFSLLGYLLLCGVYGALQCFKSQGPKHAIMGEHYEFTGKNKSYDITSVLASCVGTFIVGPRPAVAGLVGAYVVLMNAIDMHNIKVF